MREILFRGKTEQFGNWIEGSLIVGRDLESGQLEYLIAPLSAYYTEVKNIIPETIGQYTGLTDKNGKKIFEGDIVKAQDDIFGSPFWNGITGKVVYEEMAFFIEPKDPMETQWLFNECAVYEVIGNIHDNPEFLGAE